MHEVNATPTNISNSSENMQFAAGVGGFGLMMKQSEYKGEVSKQMVLELLGNSLTFDPFGYRQEFVDLVSAWQE